LPLSIGIHISAITPAPTACTDAAAPPHNILITVSIAIDVERAERIAKAIKRTKDIKKILRRPKTSEKEDHHIGAMAMLSMYKATVKFTTVGVV
jgi:hypothetical protein